MSLLSPAAFTKRLQVYLQQQLQNEYERDGMILIEPPARTIDDGDYGAQPSRPDFLADFHAGWRTWFTFSDKP